MLYRDYCCDCGRRESLWSAIKRELRRRFSKPDPLSPYQRYFDKQLLESVMQVLPMDSLCAVARPFPANAGNTIRFSRPIK